MCTSIVQWFCLSVPLISSNSGAFGMPYPLARLYLLSRSLVLRQPGMDRMRTQTGASGPSPKHRPFFMTLDSRMSFGIWELGAANSDGPLADAPTLWIATKFDYRFGVDQERCAKTGRSVRCAESIGNTCQLKSFKAELPTKHGRSL